jgi:SLT domain-containing protein
MKLALGEKGNMVMVNKKTPVEGENNEERWTRGMELVDRQCHATNRSNPTRRESNAFTFSSEHPFRRIPLPPRLAAVSQSAFCGEDDRGRILCGETSFAFP